MQPAAFQPVTDCPAAESDVHELRSRDDAVLALRQVGDHPVDLARLQLCPYIGLKGSFVGHDRMLAPVWAQATP
jgi:hypothetical protein